jgi:hypothetical protein
VPEESGSRVALSDAGVAFLPALAGAAIWVVVTERTGAAEAWDADLYWPLTFGTLFLLGWLLARSRVPAVAFVVAALLFLTHIVVAAISGRAEGASFLPLALVFWPVLTMVGGVCALLGARARKRSL